MDVGELVERPVGELLHPVAERLAALDPAGRGRPRGGRPPRRARPRAGSGRRSRPCRRRVASAPPSPRRRSPRGRPWRRGSRGSGGRSDHGPRRRAREPRGTISCSRKLAELVEGRVGRGGVALQLRLERLDVAVGDHRAEHVAAGPAAPGPASDLDGDLAVLPRRPRPVPGLPPRATSSGSRPSAVGTAASRLSTSDQPCSPSFGIRSKTWRTAWRSLKIDRDPAPELTGVGHLDGEPEPLEERVAGHGLAVVDRCRVAAPRRAPRGSAPRVPRSRRATGRSAGRRSRRPRCRSR